MRVNTAWAGTAEKAIRTEVQPPWGAIDLLVVSLLSSKLSEVGGIGHVRP